MDRHQALAELPVAYATALRLRAAGATTSLIADALGIDAKGVGPLLVLAEAKLGQLLDDHTPLVGADAEVARGDGHG